ncbi:unnamed protein product [Rhizophagus irregularis]|nr:unnamed protein product [Rhizophagus irregularis]
MNKSNLKFGYEVNLETSFYCSLCTACNSKISRENNKFEKEIKKEKNGTKSDIFSEESGILIVVNPVTELQLRISIKNGKEVLPSILVNWSFDDIKYIDFSTKVEQLVSEHIGLTFNSEYFLAYKGNSEVGVGTLLDNEITFEEFLKDFQRYISNKKKVMIIVTMKDKKKNKKKREYKDDNLENTASEETEEEIPKPKSVKTKKKGSATNRIPKESKLDEKEKMIGEIMMQLKDKYVCNLHNHKHCFVKDGHHLFLSNVSFSMWAQDIFKNNTDFETPPNHAIFSMLHSVKPTSCNSSNLNSNENSSLPILNIIQNYISEAPSINEFLEELDRKYGANKFTCYLQKFEEEEIRVNQLFRLSDAEYNFIGISKIGIRQTLRDESKKFV